jgi:nucleoid DNA-binding protein
MARYRGGNTPVDLTLDQLIDIVVVDVDEPKDIVEAVVASFLVNLREATATKRVYIRGVGIFESEIKKQSYNDINNGSIIKTSIKPKVIFKASGAFLDIVQEHRHEELERLKAKS